MSLVDGPIISGSDIPTTSDTSGYLLSTQGSTIIIKTARSINNNTPGVVGEICWDANGIHVCVAANTWKTAQFI